MPLQLEELIGERVVSERNVLEYMSTRNPEVRRRKSSSSRGVFGYGTNIGMGYEDFKGRGV